MNTGPGSEYAVELLGSQHDRASFTCGVEALDRYLRQQAGQDARRKIAVPFVLVHRETGAIAGFYTLANTSIELARLPAELANKLPKYPLVPATLLGRLGVDLNHHGKGLGEFLLLDAMRRALEASRQVASFALVVSAKDESVRRFHQQYGFLAFADAPRQLFLPMRAIKEALA